MSTQVLRYKCDLCGKEWLLRGQADVCEMMCSAEAEIQKSKSIEKKGE